MLLEIGPHLLVACIVASLCALLAIAATKSSKVFVQRQTSKKIESDFKATENRQNLETHLTPPMPAALREANAALVAEIRSKGVDL